MSQNANVRMPGPYAVLHFAGGATLDDMHTMGWTPRELDQEIKRLLTDNSPRSIARNQRSIQRIYLRTRLRSMLARR